MKDVYWYWYWYWYYTTSLITQHLFVITQHLLFITQQLFFIAQHLLVITQQLLFITQHLLVITQHVFRYTTFPMMASRVTDLRLHLWLLLVLPTTRAPTLLTKRSPCGGCTCNHCHQTRTLSRIFKIRNRSIHRNTSNRKTEHRQSRIRDVAEDLNLVPIVTGGFRTFCYW